MQDEPNRTKYTKHEPLIVCPQAYKYMIIRINRWLYSVLAAAAG